MDIRYGFGKQVVLDFDSALEQVIHDLSGRGALRADRYRCGCHAEKETQCGDAALPYPRRLQSSCALQAEPPIGLRLPCNVVVRQRLERGLAALS